MQSVAVFTLVFSLAAPVPKQETLPPFPMTVGDTREYEWRTGEKAEAAHSDTVTKVDPQKNGSTHVTVLRTYPGGETHTTVINVSATGLTRVLDAKDRTAAEPVLLLKLPATVGTKWESYGAKYEVTAEEEVTVPAGKYQSAKVLMTVEEHKTTLWFAPGVGLVRMTAGENRTLELKAFKPAQERK